MQEKQTEAPNSAGGRRKIFSQKNMSFNSEKLYLGVGGSKITVDSDCSHEIKRHLLLGRKAMTNLNMHIKKQRHYFVSKGLSSQSYGFSGSHVWM